MENAEEMRGKRVAYYSAKSLGISLWRRIVLRAFNIRVNFRAETIEALASGPAVVICKQHRSFVDGPILAVASPVPLNFAITPKHAEENRITATGIRALQWIGLGTRVAIDGARPFGLRRLLCDLRAGGRVMIFDEGRIVAPSDAPVHAKLGPEWLVRKSGAKLVEIEMRGNENSFFFAPEGRKLRPRIEIDF